MPSEVSAASSPVSGPGGWQGEIEDWLPRCPGAGDEACGARVVGALDVGVEHLHGANREPDDDHPGGEEPKPRAGAGQQGSHRQVEARE